jgi:hypothetical protein
MERQSEVRFIGANNMFWPVYAKWTRRWSQLHAPPMNLSYMPLLAELKMFWGRRAIDMALPMNLRVFGIHALGCLERG